MSKHSQKSSASQSLGSGALGRVENMHEEERPFAEIRRTVHDALRLLSLHRWMFFVPCCLVTCGAFIASLYLPRVYQATTSFEVRNDPVMINVPMSAGAASYKYFRNTMVSDLTSVEAMAEVVENLNLLDDQEKDPSRSLSEEQIQRRTTLARELGGNLEITTASPSELMDVVTVTYTGPDAKIGRRLVDEVKRTYIRRTGVWIHEFLVKQRDYFQGEAEVAAAELRRNQREETRLRLENPHVNPSDPGQVSVRLAQLEAERRELLLRRREYEAELAAQRQLLAANDPQKAQADGQSAPSRSYVSAKALALSGQIQDVHREILELRQTRGMTDAHPDIRDLVIKKDGLQEQLDEQQRMDQDSAEAGAEDLTAADDDHQAGLVGPVWTSEQARLSVQVASQTSKIKEIDLSLQTNELQMEQLQKAKDQVFEKQEEFALVMGQVAKAKQQLGLVESTLAQIEPALKAVEQNRLLQFSEGQPARGGSRPISPKAGTIVLMALAAGLAAGVLFIILAEVLDHVYRSSGQVARSLDLPLLEAIDEIVTAKDRRRLLVSRAVVIPVAVIFCLGVTGLSASMAYLSLNEPQVYEKVRQVPNAVIDLFVDRPALAEAAMEADD